MQYLDAWSYTEWFNLLGTPAAVVPVGKSPEGLPIGVQIVARPWEEEIGAFGGSGFGRAVRRLTAHPKSSPIAVGTGVRHLSRSDACATHSLRGLLVDGMN